MTPDAGVAGSTADAVLRIGQAAAPDAPQADGCAAAPDGALPNNRGPVSHTAIDWDGRTVQIEHAWIGPEARERPLVVFLHEGLGSLAMWKDFPERLCAAAGLRGLVYSRPGYGGSTPRAPEARWQPDYMHRQALEVLPALLRALDVTPRGADRPWLFGHSDGGSIALIHAAHRPRDVAGIVVLAPHILVEAFGLASIRQARTAYVEGGLRARLARHHADVDSAFWGWNQIWLDPAFATWTLEADLHRIACPVLAVQGLDDEYGTLEQIHGIARRASQTQLCVLADCGHAVHRDQPGQLIAEVSRFISSHTQGDPT